ncbi:hypothetical protein [Paenibacillus agri]|uniref:DUF4829 domain-containing protein n=1 Tax=Paenibacillus agri TaxID=2744309 RepID=A0A850EKY3_9BACL|nr:hypothetical protein [Paenibacillus agri]NUU61668.1 hypothetical protein [Paenibacillus agri]
MKKLLWILCLTALATILITGCNTNKAENAAIQAAETYKNKEYYVAASDNLLSIESIEKRNEEMKPFFTENFSEKAIATRYTTLPVSVAHTHQASVTSENLKFTVLDQTDDWTDLKYTADLVLLDQENKEIARVPLEGILTLFLVDGKWLVQGDRFDKVAFQKLL